MSGVFWPVDPRTISEEAGTRGGTHYGMDFAVREGTPVLASFDGVVVWVGNDGASGLLPGTSIKANGPALIVDIQRDDGLIARYAHLSQFQVRQGQRVAAGDTVALSGNTGFTTGPHLHWELRWDRSLGPGAWVNPRNFNPQTFDAKSATDPKKDDEDMPKMLNLRTTVDHTKPSGTENKLYFYGGPGVGIKHVANPTHQSLLNRFLADKPGEQFYPHELAVINTYLAPGAPTISQGTVQDAVTAAIKAMGAAPDAAAVAAAVEATLRDDFAAIPAAVAEEQAERLKS